MPRSLSDPSASRVLLIGTGAGGGLAPPGAFESLNSFGNLLTDKVRWGVDPEHCIRLIDPTSPQEVDLALKAAGDGVGRDGLLLVYYAGCAVTDRHGELYLALTGIDLDTLDEGDLAAAESPIVPYRQVRWRVRHNAADRRVVILDCRYLGANGATEPARILAQRAAIVRTRLIVAASAADRTARRHESQMPFTRALIDLLRDGLRHGPNVLDVQTIYTTVAERLSAANHPTPEIYPARTVESIPLIRNPALYDRDRVGQVLYAPASVTDPDLAQAVVLILRHDPDAGAMGIVINRPAKEPARDLAQDWEGFTDPPVAFNGGPTHHEGYILLAQLRREAELPVRFQPVAARVGMIPLSTEQSGVERSLESLRLFSGYLGWGPGGLEADLAEEMLVAADVTAEVAFSEDPHTLWPRLTATRSR
jgi:putative transcriptional regulator